MPLDEEQLNGSHQIVIVASSLDLSTERIVNYLNKMGIAINVIFFQVFQDGTNQYLSRVGLIDPVETESKATSGHAGERGEWNGEYYVSFGQGVDRDWKEAVKYGFICGGGGRWYSQTLFQLTPGDRVWVNIPQQGYVGVGRVTGGAVRANEFKVNADGAIRSLLEVHRATIIDNLSTMRKRRNILFLLSGFSQRRLTRQSLRSDSSVTRTPSHAPRPINGIIPLSS